MVWDPAQYRRFASHRLRPAADLLARVPDPAPSRVVDLGCGTGGATALLAERWPDADVVGVDESAEMLAVARASVATPAWVQADIAAWDPGPAPFDVVFSDAALHWLDDHEVLFPRLVAMVRPGGWFAVQMPANHDQPTHTIVTELAREPRWRARLSAVVRPAPVASAAWYLDTLEPLTDTVEVWSTTYLHVLTGEDPVANWTKGTVLRPVLAALGADADAFVAEYAARVREAYPARPDGTTVLPFTRLFVLARR